MKNSIFLILLLAVTFSACSSEKKDTNYVPSSKIKQKQNQKTSIDDRLIIPGYRVGLITGKSTEADIIKAYGKASVKVQGIEVGEGVTQKGLLIFEGTTDEIEVVMSFEGKDEPAFVRISHEFSNWKTPEGVSVNTSLADLQASNGAPFTFMGFEWDYSGLITNWNGGRFPKSFTVSLAPHHVEAVKPNMLGQVEFQSDEPDLKDLDLKIGAIAVRF